jgi:hypothetical protein
MVTLVGSALGEAKLCAVPRLSTIAPIASKARIKRPHLRIKSSKNDGWK